MSKAIPGLIRIKNSEKIITTLVDAFSEYPRLIKAFPDEKIREKATELDFRFYGIYDMRRGGAYGISQEADGVVIVTTSSKRNMSRLKCLLAGCYSHKYKGLLAQLTEEERTKRDAVLREIKSMEAEIAFPEKYLYISFLGVKKQHRGQGIGKAILEKVIEDGQRRNLPLVFYTSEPKSVGFYQQLGFKIMGITSSKEFEFINIYLIRT